MLSFSFVIGLYIRLWFYELILKPIKHPNIHIFCTIQFVGFHCNLSFEEAFCSDEVLILFPALHFNFCPGPCSWTTYMSFLRPHSSAGVISAFYNIQREHFVPLLILLSEIVSTSETLPHARLLQLILQIYPAVLNLWMFLCPPFAQSPLRTWIDSC